MSSNFIETLQQRGMLHTQMPGLETQLREVTKGYIGIDPTAPSLHIGNLATLMLLKHLQLAGHQPVVLLGGATGMVGDPSFKATERKLLDRETLLYNQRCIEKQVSRFLDFTAPNKAILLNNYTWFQEMGFLHFLRDVGKHISVNYMLAKDSVKTRLQTGISYTEFAYQLLQAYDFYYMYQHHGVKLQMGGADQWGNITTGTELIRRKAGGKAYGLTTPLITKADGEKFGKTESGNVWLDPALTSVYAFYQFWLNCSDADALVLVKRMTLYSMEEIADLAQRHQQAPHKRILQQAIAKAVTLLVHSAEDYKQAVQVSGILFGNLPAAALQTLQKEIFLTCLAGIPTIEVERSVLADLVSIVDLLTDATGFSIFSSKRLAREVLQAGGVHLNKVKVSQTTAIDSLTWLYDQYILVQRGKKHFYLIKRI